MASHNFRNVMSSFLFSTLKTQRLAIVHSLHVESLGPYVHILCMFGPKYSVFRTIVLNTLYLGPYVHILCLFGHKYSVAGPKL